MDSGFQTVLPPNAASAAADVGEWSWGIWPPSSYHPGGVNCGMADGSVRFVSETIDTGNLGYAGGRHFRRQSKPIRGLGSHGLH